MEDTVFKWALKNAVDHGGEAEVGAVISKAIAENEDFKENIDELKSVVKTKVSQVNRMSEEDQLDEIKDIAPDLLKEEEGGEEETELPDLPNVSDEVVMRLAPFPSGPLHIGNARAFVLNDEYSKRYDGDLVLMFDDTIGTEKSEIESAEGEKELGEKKIDSDAYDLIREGLDWLGIDYQDVYHKSDRLELYYDYCEKLLEKGEAYVCVCDPDKWRKEYKEEEEPCPCRSNSKEENFSRWDKMFEDYEPGEAAVRLKSGMDRDDPAMRDVVIMRISDREHPRVGNKYRVWPLMEFGWAVDDHELGSTHILRGKDLVKEDKVEMEIWDKLDLDVDKEFVHYGYLFLTHGALSKSKTAELIGKGEIEDWYDPRTWTLQSLKRRGIKPEAVREFVKRFGLSKSDVEVGTEMLYSENRKIIDPKANRYFFVSEPIKLRVRNLPSELQAEVPLHPDYEERGFKEYTLEGEEVEFWVDRKDFMDREMNNEVRLMDLFNVKLEVLGPDEVIAEFTSKELKEDVDIIHWVKCDESDEATVVMVNGDKKEGYVEKKIAKEDEGSVIQFVRFGFSRLFDKEELLFYYTHN